MSILHHSGAFPAGEAHFLITGPAGNLELLTQASPEGNGLAVICHPHPLQEGTMHNKVVHTAARAFHHLGLHTIRFNYRGVGLSQGEYGNSEGEVADLRAVLAWAAEALSDPAVWLAGFSFGAYIAARGAAEYGCQQLFSIAPAVHHQSYDALPKLRCPWVVVQGEQDTVVEPQLVYDWVATQPGTALKLVTLPEATHFFHGNLGRLRQIMEENFVANPV